ncbi:MAG: DUF2007 domain-containing protein [Ignavibacteriaceae bacterium]|jgi:hypothetical protein
MFCPNCKAEYREGFTHCNDCDVDLVATLPGQKENSVTEEGLVSDKSILDDQSIEYFLQGENTAYIRGYIDPAILMVREDQIQTVRELLKNFDLKFTLFSANK